MPQLDVFTYMNLSFYFFISFFSFYVISAYCIFPVFNFVQKSRFFFSIALDEFLVKTDIFNNAKTLGDIRVFSHNTKFKNFKINFNILNCFYQSTSVLFFLELEFAYLNFSRLNSVYLIKSLLCLRFW